MSNKIQNNPTAFLKHFSNMTLEGVVRTMSATKFNFTNPLPTGIVRIETSQGKKLHTNTNTFISARVCVCVKLIYEGAFACMCVCGCSAAAATCQSANSDKPFLKTLPHSTLHSHFVTLLTEPFIISCNRRTLLLLRYYCITLCPGVCVCVVGLGACICVCAHTVFLS